MIIRINLHPNKKNRKKSNPGMPFVLVGLIIAFIIVFIAWKHTEGIDKETNKYKSETDKIKSEITALQEKMKDVANMKTKIKELNDRQYILGRLSSIRVGPQYVLNELSRLLSNPRDVLQRKEVAELGWTLSWEPENVMLVELSNKTDDFFEIRGVAKSMDDIQEFWTRMKTSTFFRNIDLTEVRKDNDSSGMLFQFFTFKTNANFYYQTTSGRALVDSMIKDSGVEESADPTAENAQKEK